MNKRIRVLDEEHQAVFKALEAGRRDLLKADKLNNAMCMRWDDEEREILRHSLGQVVAAIDRVEQEGRE